MAYPVECLSSKREVLSSICLEPAGYQRLVILEGDGEDAWGLLLSQSKKRLQASDSVKDLVSKNKIESD